MDCRLFTFPEVGVTEVLLVLHSKVWALVENEMPKAKLDTDRKPVDEQRDSRLAAQRNKKE